MATQKKTVKQKRIQPEWLIATFTFDMPIFLGEFWATPQKSNIDTQKLLCLKGVTFSKPHFGALHVSFRECIHSHHPTVQPHGFMVASLVGRFFEEFNSLKHSNLPNRMKLRSVFVNTFIWRIYQWCTHSFRII